jgi:hypothetical protein
MTLSRSSANNTKKWLLIQKRPQALSCLKKGSWQKSKLSLKVCPNLVNPARTLRTISHLVSPTRISFRRLSSLRWTPFRKNEPSAYPIWLPAEVPAKLAHSPHRTEPINKIFNSWDYTKSFKIGKSTWIRSSLHNQGRIFRASNLLHNKHHKKRSSRLNHQLTYKS